MEVHQYIIKHNLDSSIEFNKIAKTAFCNDLNDEFNEKIVFWDAKNSYINFQIAVQSIRNKWDAINKKTGKLSELFWGYFYASNIVPKRKKFFGNY